eukprot:m.66786 g.66786  ORF g.66786 m.66786 type:complete len:449 (+) comp7423_c0_seq1:452-1798(+)
MSTLSRPRLSAISRMVASVTDLMPVRSTKTSSRHDASRTRPASERCQHHASTTICRRGLPSTRRERTSSDTATHSTSSSRCRCGNAAPQSAACSADSEIPSVLRNRSVRSRVRRTRAGRHASVSCSQKEMLSVSSVPAQCAPRLKMTSSKRSAPSSRTSRSVGASSRASSATPPELTAGTWSMLMARRRGQLRAMLARVISPMGQHAMLIVSSPSRNSRGSFMNRSSVAAEQSSRQRSRSFDHEVKARSNMDTLTSLVNPRSSDCTCGQASARRWRMRSLTSRQPLRRRCCKCGLRVASAMRKDAVGATLWWRRRICSRSRRVQRAGERATSRKRRQTRASRVSNSYTSKWAKMRASSSVGRSVSSMCARVRPRVSPVCVDRRSSHTQAGSTKTSFPLGAGGNGLCLIAWPTDGILCLARQAAQLCSSIRARRVGSNPHKPQRMQHLS